MGGPFVSAGLLSNWFVFVVPVEDCVAMGGVGGGGAGLVVGDFLGGGVVVQDVYEGGGRPCVVRGGGDGRTRAEFE